LPDVSGYVRRPASVAECKQIGAVDHATCDLREAVAGADLVVLCTPIAQMRALIEQAVPALQRGAVVTDVGASKGAVVDELEPLVLQAGATLSAAIPWPAPSGWGSGTRAPIFSIRRCAWSRPPHGRRACVRLVEDLWRAVGAAPLRLTPAAHDDLVSRSSHLAHVVAAELANYVLSPAHPREQAMLCASGFRDTTRVAASSPEMWRDIALANRKNLRRVLGVFIEGLQEFQHALATSDGKAIQEFFAKARNVGTIGPARTTRRNNRAPRDALTWTCDQAAWPGPRPRPGRPRRSEHGFAPAHRDRARRRPLVATITVPVPRV